MNAYTAEFLGSALLILFGNGVVANVVLARTKGHSGGWIVIAAGWAIAVYIGAFCAAKYSGAHLNPAVTLAMAAAGKPLPGSIAGFLGSQMAGAMLGALLVYLSYRAHFQATQDTEAKLACFCTGPAIRHPLQNLFCEFLGTLCLILPIFLMTDPTLAASTPGGPEVPIGLGSLGLLPVALLVFGIGLSLGGTTGYAINPARDLGPRLIHALVPIPGKGPSDWRYAWIPVLGPLLGALAAAGVYRALLSA